MENNLEVITTNDEFEVVRYWFDDNDSWFLIRFKESGQTFVPTESIARLLKYSNGDAMLSADKVLDALSEIKKRTGLWPVSENNGLIRLECIRTIPENIVIK